MLILWSVCAIMLVSEIFEYLGSGLKVPTFDKIYIFVSMATMEAPWMLGMFQLLILEGLVYVKYILVEAVI